MDYSNYTISSESVHLPQLGECEKCPFVNKCLSGEKCLVKKQPNKHRDRQAYYRAYYLRKKQQKELNNATKQYILGEI